MQTIGYPGLEAHRRIHSSFRENTLPALEAELEKTEYSTEAMDHFLGVCAGWLISHTLTEDLAITGKPVHRWENLLPDEELTAMKKVIIQLVFDMFHLESQLLSDTYGGEEFGKGVYYHLVYGTETGEEKQEVFLVFEDRVLINTVGKILGIKTNKLDDMLIHAARYTARQFVKQVMEHFPSMDGYELREENLLFYDQFQKHFQQEKMQMGLLFDTGAGYFAFCLIAPHLLRQGIGTPIQQENAMAEVEEYLSQKHRLETGKASQKPKILLVDDSPGYAAAAGGRLPGGHGRFRRGGHPRHHAKPARSGPVGLRNAGVRRPADPGNAPLGGGLCRYSGYLPHRPAGPGQQDSGYAPAPGRVPAKKLQTRCHQKGD